MNVAFVGGTSSGKTTMIGHLLATCGGKREKELYNQEKKFLRNKSLHKAVNLKGCPPLQYFTWQNINPDHPASTYDTSMQQFKSVKHNYTILDTPGHKDYIKNLIRGVSHADAAVLVIDASTFDENLGRQSSSRAHPLICQTMGVKQMICAVNKMDSNLIIDKQ